LNPFLDPTVTPSCETDHSSRITESSASAAPVEKTN
jgi:hypothetical protein